MLAVAFLPYPPALLPALSGPQVPELVALRSVVAQATSEVLTGAGQVLILGAADRAPVRGLSGIGGPAHPPGDLSSAVAGVLLDAAGYRGARASTVDAADCPSPADGALLVMAEGSAGHGLTAPAGDRTGATGFDELVATALRTGSAPSLAGLDPAAAERAGATGATWRAAGRLLTGRRAACPPRLLHRGTPFGVTYFVAVWTLS